MDIAYFAPLGSAWRRMQTILFAPFDIAKWFVLGFTAWLASLTEWHGPGGNGGSQVHRKIDADSWEGAVQSAGSFLSGGLEAFLVTTVLALALLFFLVFLWISSRGSFLFLDNVVHDRCRVKEPWSRYSRLGNSLFLWRLVYTLICLVAIGLVIAIGVISALPLALDHIPGSLSIPGFAFLGIAIFLFTVVALYVDFFLLHCVVPVMYKHDLTAMNGWKKFYPLLKERIWEFLLYGIFCLVLNVILGMVIFAFGLMTCCIGWIILVIPYIGTVLLLPAFVFFRSLDIEFIAQFGDDFDLVSLADGNGAADAEMPAPVS